MSSAHAGKVWLVRFRRTRPEQTDEMFNAYIWENLCDLGLKTCEGACYQCAGMDDLTRLVIGGGQRTDSLSDLTRGGGTIIIMMRMRIDRKEMASMKNRPSTPQRRLLLDTLREAKGHLDARELYRRAVEKDSHISLATIYRLIELQGRG